MDKVPFREKLEQRFLDVAYWLTKPAPPRAEFNNYERLPTFVKWLQYSKNYCPDESNHCARLPCACNCRLNHCLAPLLSVVRKAKEQHFILPSLKQWVELSTSSCREEHLHCLRRPCRCACRSGHCALPRLVLKRSINRSLAKTPRIVRRILPPLLIFTAVIIYLLYLPAIFRQLTLPPATLTPNSPSSTAPQPPENCDWDPSYLEDV